MVNQSLDAGKLKPAGFIVLVGVAAAISALRGLLQTTTPPAGVAVGVIPPLAMGVAIGGMGYWLYRGDLGKGEIWRVAGWSVAGAIFLGTGAVLGIAYQWALGLPTHVEVQLVANTATGGAFIGVLVGHYDSKQRATRDRLRQLIILNRIVRHEIRNDMNLIYAWSLELQSQVSGEVRSQLRKIIETSYHVNELTQNAKELIDLIETGEEPETRPVRISGFFDEVVRTAERNFGDAEFEVLDPVPDTEVQGDELLRTIFQNLLNNAVLHNDKEYPVVEVSFEDENGFITVSIADNGPGVPDNMKNEIFGKGEMGLKSEGTGIGLYLVNSLIGSYGGDVWVEDNEPEGAVFNVRLRKA